MILQKSKARKKDCQYFINKTLSEHKQTNSKALKRYKQTQKLTREGKSYNKMRKVYKNR